MDGREYRQLYQLKQLHSNRFTRSVSYAASIMTSACSGSCFVERISHRVRLTWATP